MTDGAQAVARAARLLRNVASAGELGARLVDLAKRSELHNATAHRLLRAMTAEGLLSYDAVRKRYFIGPEVFRFASTGAGADLRRLFRPALESVAERTGLAGYLSVREGAEVICVDCVVGNAIVQIVPYTIGSRRPLGVGAAGLALLAMLADAEIEAVLRAQAQAKTRQSLLPDRMRKIINESRRSGFVYNPGLFIRGVCGLGIPVSHPGAGLACLSVVGLQAQFASLAERQKIAEILETEVAGAGARLAWSPTRSIGSGVETTSDQKALRLGALPAA